MRTEVKENFNATNAIKRLKGDKQRGEIIVNWRVRACADIHARYCECACADVRGRACERARERIFNESITNARFQIKVD